MMAGSIDLEDLQISKHVIGQISHDGFHMKIYRGMMNNALRDEFYCSPIVALVVDGPEKVGCDRSPRYVYDELTGQHQVQFLVELWNDQVQKVATDYAKKIRKSPGNDRAGKNVSLIPFEQIMLYCTIRSPLFECPGKWRNFQMSNRSDFTLNCPSKEAAEQVVKVIETEPKLFARHFQVKFGLKAQQSRRKGITITVENIAAGEFFMKLNRHFLHSDHVLLTAEDARTLVSESVNSVLTEFFGENEVIAAGSEFAVHFIIEKIIVSGKEKVEQDGQSVWDLVYWNDEGSRPDRVCAALNKSFETADKDDLNLILEGKIPANPDERMIALMKLLRDNRDRIEWSGSKFIPKPLLLSKINLSAIRSGQLCHEMNVTYLPVSLSVDLNVPQKTNEVNNPILNGSVDSHLRSDANGGQSSRTAKANGNADGPVMMFCRSSLNNSPPEGVLVLSKSKSSCFIPATEESFLRYCANYRGDNLAQIIEFLLKCGVDVNCVDERGNNGLMLLCESHNKDGLVQLVKLLVGHGIDVNCMNAQGMNALLILTENCEKDDLIGIVKFLIASKIVVNCVDKRGRNALIVLCGSYCKSNLIDIVNLLIDNRIHLNCVDSEGMNPLMILCRNYYDENLLAIIKSLVSGGIDVNCVSVDGWNALMFLCRYYDRDNLMEIIQFLIDCRININCVDNRGWNVLLHLCLDYARDNVVDVMKTLTANGVDVNCVSDEGQNALLLSCQNYRNDNLFQVIEFLIANNIDVNCVDNKGWNALMFVCKKYRKDDLVDIVKLLIAQKIDVNCVSKDGSKALGIVRTISDGKLRDSIVKLLQENGAVA